MAKKTVKKVSKTKANAETKAKSQKSKQKVSAKSKSAESGFKLSLSALKKIQLPELQGLWRWSDHQGQKIVIYFYPKDDTPGCTIQGQEFSRLLKDFAKENAVVLGVSRDPLKSHQKFRDKYDLKVGLLSDETETICKLFDVIKEKNLYGRKSMGIERSTFLLGEKGQLLKQWRKVKAAGHAEEVLNYLRSLE